MRALLIGAGGIANHHARVLKELGVEISYVFDINKNHAYGLIRKWGGTVVNDLEAAIREVDLVYLLTPPSRRVYYAELVMKAGKPLFVEKPVAATLEDARRLEEICRQYHGLCMVGFTQRFREGYRKLMQRVQSHDIGTITQVFSFRMGPGPGFGGSLQDSWRTDRNLVCGMTIESLSHDIDFLQSIAGDIKEVKGVVAGTIESLPAFDNNSDAVFTFESGAIGSVMTSWSCAIPYNKKGIIGTRGAVFLEGNDIWDSTKITCAGPDGMETEELRDIFQSGEGYLEEARYFLQCISEKKEPCCNLTTGRKVLEVSYKILESAKGIR